MNNMDDLRNIGVASIKQIDRRQRNLSESTSVEGASVDITEHQGKETLATVIPTAPVFSSKDVNVKSAELNMATNRNVNDQEEIYATSNSVSQESKSALDGKANKLKFQEEEHMEINQGTPGIPLPGGMPMPGGMPAPAGIPTGIPTGIPVAPPLNFGAGGLVTRQAYDIKVVGRVARYKNCASKAIDTEIAKAFYEANKANPDILARLKENDYSLPKIKKDGTVDTVNENFQREPKDNKFSIGRFRILFGTKYEELETADTFKVDMSEDNVEFYVFKSNGQESDEKLIEIGKLSEGNFAYLRKSEVFELMKATSIKAFDIEGASEKAQLYIGVSHKTKDGKKEAVPTLKVLSGEKPSVKLAATNIPHVALRDRSNKEVTMAGTCINEAVFRKHYGNAPIPTHPALVLEAKTPENAKRLEAIRKNMEIPFDEQDQATLNTLGINVTVYDKLLKPSKGGNTRQKVLIEQQKGFNALVKMNTML